MKTTLIALILCASTGLFAQYSKMDKMGIEEACMNYIEGFYEGDTMKLIKALKPSLYKYGYWKNKEGEYKSEGLMTFREALDFAVKLSKNQTFAKAKAAKSVDVLDMSNHIACAKVTAGWGIDYVLLSKDGGRWMIEQVLWEGPLAE